MNIDKVKSILENDRENILGRNSVFKNSELAKAIKKRKMEKDAIAYLIERVRDYHITEWLLNTLVQRYKMSHKQASEWGIIDALSRNNGYYPGYCCSFITQSFTSREELLSHVKERFEIDLEKGLPRQFDYLGETAERLRSLTAPFFSNGMRSRMTSKEICGNYAELHKQFYLESLDIMFTLSKLHIARYLPTSFSKDEEGVHEDNELKQEALQNIALGGWGIDFDDYVSLVKRVFPSDSEEDHMQQIVSIATLVWSAAKDHRDEEFVLRTRREMLDKAIPALKTITGKYFPLPFGWEDGKRLALSKLKQCYASVLTLYNDGKKASLYEISDKDRKFFFREFLSPIMKDPNFRKIFESEVVRDVTFISVVLACTPAEELGEVYNFLKKVYPYEVVECGISFVYREEGLSFNPTIEMTMDQAHRHAGKIHKWYSAFIPVEYIHDVEFIERLVMSYGKSSILFGDGWDSNEGVITRIDVNKLPDSFFEKYMYYIDWRAVSKCKSLTKAFLYKHQANIVWSVLRPEIAAMIDEDLAEIVMMHQQKQGGAVLRKTSNLSPSFELKYLSYICHREENYDGKRRIKATQANHSLQDYVRAIR